MLLIDRRHVLTQVANRDCAAGMADFLFGPILVVHCSFRLWDSKGAVVTLRCRNLTAGLTGQPEEIVCYEVVRQEYQEIPGF